MEYKGIIITGTRGAGKSTIARRIYERDSSFQVVPAVTTRKPREDDIPNHYVYLDKKKFFELRESGKLLVWAEYQEDSYCITNESYESVVKKGKIPILVIAPQLMKDLADETFLSIFVDAPDDILDKRLLQRQGQPNERTQIQRKEDRQYKRYCTYVMSNLNLKSTVELVTCLWEHRNTGGILPERLIRLMIECNMLLENVKEINNIKSASYDISLGDEYYSQGKIKTLTDKVPFIRIDPYDYAIVTSAENANLPNDVAARFGLSVALFCQGVILSNGPQVDPGFKGKLLCLLFNTSNSPVILKRQQHYATIEFNKLVEVSSPYRGKYQNKLEIIHYLPSNTLKGAVSELKEELERVKSESQRLNTTIMGVISVLLAIIAILLTLR